ncbi:MAG TPA: hypothetical protein PK014_03520 [Thermoanaerobaculia bacterium]|nr:hypothetical protein [Thermoanaerobaculia bacterium]HUM29156.1 hypothetical protein [Thermoanaerobaculia bacterium]HXK67533.1 hypothetical protein [Thermoanaerobaculia bacterium]
MKTILSIQLQILLWVILSFFLCLGCGANAIKGSVEKVEISYDIHGRHVVETFMGKIDTASSYPASLCVSPDGRHMAVAVKDGLKVGVVVDGIHVDSYMKLFSPSRGGPLGGTFRYSPDSQHLTYIVRGLLGWHVVMDGVKQDGYKKVSLPVFSRDGTRWAYSAETGDGSYLVTSDNTYGPYSKVMIPVFSQDSQHLAFIAKGETQSFYVLDGVTQKIYGQIVIGSHQFSPDGTRFAYVIDKDSGLNFVVDGEIGESYRNITEIIFSPDSRHIAYAGLDSEGYRAVIDGKKGKPWKQIQNLQFSPDGTRLAYVAKNDEQNTFVIIDETTWGPYLDAGSPAFSSDGKNIACPVQGPDRTWVVLVNGDPVFQAEGISVTAAFCEEGNILATRVRGFHGSYLVVGDTVHPTFDQIMILPPFQVEEGAGILRSTRNDELQGIFPPGCNHSLYTARKGRESVLVMDGKVIQEFQQVNQPEFSPDGRHVLFREVRISDRPNDLRSSPPIPDLTKYQTLTMNLDGRSGKTYSRILMGSENSFDDSNSFHYLAMVEDHLLLVEETIVPLETGEVLTIDAMIPSGAETEELKKIQSPEPFDADSKDDREEPLQSEVKKPAPITVDLKAGGYQYEFDLSKCHMFPGKRNRYLDLEPGTILVLASDEERLEITPLRKIVKIGPFETRVVEEREWKDGNLVEVSRNYYSYCWESMDIYYFGEDVDIYRDGKIVSHEGSWRAGENGARPGLIMPWDALVGMKYYQEIAPGIAMDRAEVVSTNETVETPNKTFTRCIKIREGSALNPGEEEYKYYAHGIGLVKDGDLLFVEKKSNFDYSR